MSPSDRNYESEDSLDARLRAVPLPEGFVERLRNAVVTDDELDAVVATVSVPDGLVDRLRQIVLSDETMDVRLCDVHVPTGMLERICQSAAAEDREVVVTAEPLWIAGRRRKRRPGRATAAKWATAVSLLVALGLAYAGVISEYLLSISPTQSTGLPNIAAVQRPSSGGSAEPGTLESKPTLDARDKRAAAETIASDLTPPKPLMTFSGEPPRRAWSPDLRGADEDLLDAGSRSRWGVFATHRSFDDLPELRRIAPLSPRGIEWPLAPGSNTAFLIRYGVHPFVSPAAHPQLCSTVVPLEVDSSSYELARRYVEDGELPPPSSLRTEAFLAAMDYGFPCPTQQELGLSASGGPSPFGGQGVQLMQVGVQSALLPNAQHAPVCLVVAVDVSSSMRWGGRLEIVRQALRRMAWQMGPLDRLTLVAFSETAEIVVDDVGREEVEQFLAGVNSLTLRSSTNVGDGLLNAYGAAQQAVTGHEIPARVVLLTDGLAEFDRGAAERIERRLAEAAAHGTILDVIDLGQEKAADPQLASLAQAGGGRLTHAVNADQVRWALLQGLTNRSQLVATGVSLKVTFNPRAVSAYRLFGHEANSLAGALPERTTTDFFDDQSASALYELQWIANGSEEVATVELTWAPPDGTRQSIVRRVKRSDFAVSFDVSALSLQEAALAAAAAEVLRESPFARVPNHAITLARIADLAGHVDSRLYQRPTFAEFLAFLEQAKKARPSRGSRR